MSAMKAFVPLLIGAALILTQAQSDASAEFPSLQTTVRDPRADAGAPLTTCAVLGGQRLCDEPLANAWCRQNGFARYINWSTVGPAGAGCREDSHQCAVVVTLTCARVPIA